MFSNWVGITPKDFEIVGIDFDENRENATVKMEVMVKKPAGTIERRPLPPFRWKRIGNEWFLEIDQSQRLPRS